MIGRELPRWINLTVLLLIVPGQIHAGADSIQTNVPASKDAFARDFKIGCILSYRHVGFPIHLYVIHS
jgi:hypothetical protein